MMFLLLMLKEVLTEFIFGVWLIKNVFCIVFLIIYKTSESAEKTYYQNNQKIILKRAKDYYENDKERLRKQARDKYRNLTEEEKNKKREYGRKRYHNMSKEKKQKLKEYQ